jgi:hypothetical protein
MRKTIRAVTYTAIVGFATAFAAAQTPAPPSQTPAPQTPAPQSAAPQTGSSSTERRITVTGCLKAAPPSSATAPGAAGATGTTGTAGAAGATGTAGSAAAGEIKFLLTEAAQAPAEATAGGAAAAPPPAAPSASSSSQTYRLVANEAALSPHVGKKLELTGTLDPSAPKPSGSTSDAPALRVESGKVLANTCSQ